MMDESTKTIVLAGNPNVGKSTIFNCLTGMHQHTGNWAGKTVSNAEGLWKVKKPDMEINLIDAPGCYSLEASSAEEEVARTQILDPSCQGIIVVCDGTCLERNLILLFQILSYRRDVILCINLMDQVRKKGIEINVESLEEILGIQIVTTESSKKKEIRAKLAKAVSLLIESKADSPVEEDYKGEGLSEDPMPEPEELAKQAEMIAQNVVKEPIQNEDIFLKIDRALTNPVFGYAIMFCMLIAILWITIKGANYPSELLSKVLFSFETPLYEWLLNLGVTINLAQMVAFGVYRVLAWVVSVMLPPMAIFFPLFTILEDWGFLPRIAFNLDRCFKCCKACGKQALTMCMGLGCNASAVVGCRIIDSKRERLLAMITNSIMPCNGRFPILIAIISMFFAAETGIKSAVILASLIILAIAMTLIATGVLSKTLLKGMKSSFVLELPAYRKPEFAKVVVRSVFDRTLFVLGRAVIVAAPCGMIIWIMANISFGGTSAISIIASFLDPVGKLIGLDGVILTAFLLGIPANEIVLPMAMMIYMSQGTLTEIMDLDFFRQLLIDNGWTMLTALNMLIFTLMHWPCATTLLSIKKETGSIKWTIVAFAIPLILGFLLCLFTSLTCRFFL